MKYILYITATVSLEDLANNFGFNTADDII